MMEAKYRSLRPFVAPLWLVLAWALNACSSVAPAPAVPGQIAGESDKTYRQNQPQAQLPDSESQYSLTLDSLVAAAELAQSKREWQESIELAERGLRLDRIQPRLYLILSESYWQLGNMELARNFARQGLRYTSSDSRLRKRLQNLAN